VRGKLFKNPAPPDKKRQKKSIERCDVEQIFNVCVCVWRILYYFIKSLVCVRARKTRSCQLRPAAAHAYLRARRLVDITLSFRRAEELHGTAKCELFHLDDNDDDNLIHSSTNIDEANVITKMNLMGLERGRLLARSRQMNSKLFNNTIVV
jgi:hypothetical protein